MPLVRSMFYIYLYFCAFYRLADKLFISPKAFFMFLGIFFCFVLHVSFVSALTIWFHVLVSWHVLGLLPYFI